MTNLTDTQSVLLSTASQRDSGSLYPYPATLTAPKPAIVTSVGSLVRLGLAEEREVADLTLTARTEDDRRIGIFITQAGLVAIGVAEGAPGEEAPSMPAPAEPAAGQTKTALVIGLLRREEGATLDELVGATGWLPHTARAALTGLRKKGHAIEKSRRDDATCYHIASAA